MHISLLMPISQRVCVPGCRMMEKNQMLDQLYNTLKQLKQEFEASRQVRAPGPLCTAPCNTAF